MVGPSGEALRRPLTLWALAPPRPRAPTVRVGRRRSGGEGSSPLPLGTTTVGNRAGFMLVVGAVVAMTFGRAERRERMLE